MTLEALIDLVDAHYPDELVGRYFRGEKDCGDSLAQFLALELRDTFDEDASDEDQLGAADDAIEMAVQELIGVQEALAAEQQKLRRAAYAKEKGAATGQ